MRAYIKPCEAETETNEADAGLAAIAGLPSTNLHSRFAGEMQMPRKKDRLRSVFMTCAAKRAADSPPEKPRGMDWIMVAIWSFAVFSFGALLFCLYAIHAKCYGGWGF